MRNLSDRISREFLPAVASPSQYVGLEFNARRPNVDAAGVRIVLAFPDAYRIGISHMGHQLLYHLCNDIPGTACDRTYCPMPDAEQAARVVKIPLWGWESGRAVADFDIVGFSLPYELCVTNMLTMLDLAGVPLRWADRNERHPLIVAGDALADTPEPIADFIDIFLVGDGEVNLPALIELVRQAGPNGLSRHDLLLQAARSIPGAYVPRFYRSIMNRSGMHHVEPARPDVPAVIHHAHLSRLSDSPAPGRPLVPLADAVHDRVVIEIMRGCPNSCRFCQAGFVKLPVRIRPVEQIVEIAKQAIEATGYREISLLSLSTSDYPELPELIERLNSEFADKHVSISLPSLHVGSELRKLPAMVSAVRKGGMTIAAEAGSDRIRRAIHKDISDDDMLSAVEAAYRAGWRSVKVYFLAGLPGEREEDIDAIFNLARRLSHARRAVDGQTGAISASVSWFVPKPHTPMQWCSMQTNEYFRSVRNRLRDLSRRSAVSFKFHKIERSIFECVICRADRRIGKVIENVWRRGARMDAWDEHFSFENWLSAFEQEGIDPADFAHKPFATDQPTPWSHISCPRSEEHLLEQYNLMLRELQNDQRPCNDRGMSPSPQTDGQSQ